MLQYAGKMIPKLRRSQCYKQGRLPESERAPGHYGMAAAGWRKLYHSTMPEIRHGSSANPNAGEYMRKLNKMFNQTVSIREVPAASRGRAGKDLSKDPMFVALRDMPVDAENWRTDGQEYSEDSARKLQSKIAAYAKAGAGTFKTTYRGKRVYVMKISATYEKQRNHGAD